jgi:hypothetical protein
MAWSFPIRRDLRGRTYRMKLLVESLMRRIGMEVFSS